MDRHQTVKGRGATSNPASRFEPTKSFADNEAIREAQGEFDEFIESDPRTTFIPDRTKSLITTNKSPDVPFDQSINAYKGCEHGCVYCFARPTHAYLDLSPGLDFETKIFYKTNPVDRLREALENPRYRCQTIAMGTNTDPYQPAERKFEITRKILETMLEYRHPVSIATKGSLILRDLDVLSELAKLQLVSVAVSITTLDRQLKSLMEPRAASGATRLRMVSALSQASIPVSVLLAPVIPFLNDHEIESIVEKSAAAGAESVGYVVLRLPLEVKDLFVEWLEEHYPLKAQRIMNRMRDLHGGRVYKSDWGVRMRGSGTLADLIAKRFEMAIRKNGLQTNVKYSEQGRDRSEDVVQMSSTKLRTDLFRVPDSGLGLFAGDEL